MTQERSARIDAFLKAGGWEGAVRAPLAGDASFRRYERVRLAGRRAVLMDAPPDKEDVRPFLNVAERLLAAGLSAPEVLARDIAQGLLLLEDLGDDLFTPLLHRKAGAEEELYLAAAETLATVQRQVRLAPGDFPSYDTALLQRECGLLVEWFLPVIAGDAQKLAEEYHSIWGELLARIPALPPVLVLRDYHADNLLWLPQRNGAARIGLLDFQDAVIGSPAYDVVSFLEDARRDVGPATVRTALARYLEVTQLPPEDFHTAYAILGAQRNCKIIGIFLRLAVRDGKKGYLPYLPRVWGHLAHDLAHPTLAPLKRWMGQAVPESLRGIPVLGQAEARA